MHTVVVLILWSDVGLEFALAFDIHVGARVELAGVLVSEMVVDVDGDLRALGFPRALHARRHVDGILQTERRVVLKDSAPNPDPHLSFSPLYPH